MTYSQVYLVGDPQQLPATVISPRATAHGYNVSLFRRLQANGFPVQARPGSHHPCSHGVFERWYMESKPTAWAGELA